MKKRNYRHRMFAVSSGDHNSLIEKVAGKVHMQPKKEDAMKAYLAMLARKGWKKEQPPNDNL